MGFVVRRYNTGHCIRDIHKHPGALSATMAQMLGAKRIGGAVGCLAAGVSLWAAAKDPQRAWRQTDNEKLPARELKGPKQAVVVGAGVAGVSTAYQLAKRGWKVTLLEASPQPGSQCSAVAAGGMQKSNPVLTKESWGEVMKSWILPGNSLVLKLFIPPFHSGEFKFFQIVWSSALDPLFLRWLSKFTLASLFPGAELKQRQQHQLQFTIFALDRLHQLLAELSLEEEVGLNGSGALKVLPEGTAPPSGANRLSLEPVARIERDEAVVMERSLASWPNKWSCADQETESWSGNSEKFTHAMARHCQALGVNMATGTRVTALQGDATRVERIITEEEVLNIGPGVEVVVAAGAWTPLLLSTMGLFCPVYPMKGYSVAMDLPPHGSSMRPAEEDLPKRMLVDGKLYVTRLGEQVP